jgi:hypothetical protein
LLDGGRKTKRLYLNSSTTECVVLTGEVRGWDSNG